MADRRMFTKKITDGDVFTSMPPTTQCLYFHLCMGADDDGFSNNIRIAMFNAHASTDDFNTLIAKRLIIPFESGVIVIKHWKMHNYIRNDRYVETKYVEERAQLVLKENGVYTLDTIGIPNGYQMDTEDSIGKNSIDKDSIGKVSIGEESIGEESKDKKSKHTCVAYYPNDELLNTAFKNYIEMRKKVKAPMTDNAIELAMKKLESLSGGNNDIAIEILEQSIMNSWKGLFPLKDKKPEQMSFEERWAAL